VGGGGNDTLNGRGSADEMAGGAGDDRYFVDDEGDDVTELEDEGRDTVFTDIDFTLKAGLSVDILRARVDSGLALTGNELDNTIVGGAGDDGLSGGGGNDVLNGLAGADDMVGGAGDDRYFIDDAGDVVVELDGEGTDTVFTDIDFTLEAGVSVEALRAHVGTGLTLTGNERDNSIVGAAGDDSLSGGAGNDVLNGLAGADDMRGGAGNDRYFVDDAADQVTEAAGEGIDTIYTDIDYTLQTGMEVENLRAHVDTGLRLGSNELNNNIVGGAGDDTLEGGGGRTCSTAKPEAMHSISPRRTVLPGSAISSPARTFSRFPRQASATDWSRGAVLRS
jgi:serralysin